MKTLCDMKCEACRIGAPVVSDVEIAELSPQIPDWTIEADNNIKKLRRVYKFKNFAEAMIFTNSVADLAEANGHHPAILTEWGHVTVTYWTHKIKGIHKTDFIMAAKTDLLYGGIS